ncbi:MAG: LytR C-terminal domain-containing protein [Actinomycetales bacterium]
MADEKSPLDTPPGAPAPPHRPPAHRPPVRSAEQEWTQEDEDRYQQQRLRQAQRAKVRRRQGLSFFAIVLVVALIGVFGAAINQGVISLPFGNDDPVVCPTPVTDVAAPGDVKVNVLNATTTKGLASRTSQELSGRGYSVASTGNAPDAQREFPDPAQVRYGPDSLAEAKSVQAQVSGAVLVEEPERTDTTVDLVLGSSFTELAPADAAAQAIAPTPVESPEGCTPAS